jgi:acetyl esterase/lipase
MATGASPQTPVPTGVGGGVDMICDIVFGQSRNVEGQVETLELDIYQPKAASVPPRPAVLWFHGGGFTFGNDKRQVYIPMFAGAFAGRGYVGVAPDYRLRAHPIGDPDGAVRDAVEDARMALQWVRANAKTYGIDSDRIALAGGSAGGMTVLNLVHDAAHPINGKSDGVFAVLDMWGTPGQHRPLFDRVNPASPPTLMVHGTADALVPYQNSVAFASELTDAGVDNVLLTLPDAPHTPLMHFDHIVAVMAEFLAQHIIAPRM